MGEVIELRVKGRIKEAYQINLNDVFGALYWEIARLEKMRKAGVPLQVRQETLNTLNYIHAEMGAFLKSLIARAVRW